MSNELTPITLDHDIAVIAKRYRKAGGLGIQVLNLVGGQAENLLERLPDPVKDRLEEATTKALNVAVKAAARWWRKPRRKSDEMAVGGDLIPDLGQ